MDQSGVSRARPARWPISCSRMRHTVPGYSDTEPSVIASVMAAISRPASMRQARPMGHCRIQRIMIWP